MRNDIVTTLGFVGAMINLIMLIPQGIATWQNRRDDIALSGLCLDDVAHKVAIREAGVTRLVLCDADSRAHGVSVLG